MERAFAGTIERSEVDAYAPPPAWDLMSFGMEEASPKVSTPSWTDPSPTLVLWFGTTRDLPEPCQAIRQEGGPRVRDHDDPLGPGV